MTHRQQFWGKWHNIQNPPSPPVKVCRFVKLVPSVLTANIRIFCPVFRLCSFCPVQATTTPVRFSCEGPNQSSKSFPTTIGMETWRPSGTGRLYPAHRGAVGRRKDSCSGSVIALLAWQFRRHHPRFGGDNNERGPVA